MRELLSHARAIPGVTEAGASSRVPIDEGGWGKYLWATAHEPARLEEVGGCDFTVVSGSDFFRALGMMLVRGRLLDEPSRQEVVLNQTAARRLFGDGDPVGQQISVDPPARFLPPRPGDPPYRFFTVAGVVRDVRSAGPAKPATSQPWIRQEQLEEMGPSMYLVLRSQADEGPLRRALRSELTALDASLALYDVKSMEERAVASVSRERFSAFLLALFAALALLLAMLGVYAVMSYSVEQRVREIGIRMALGATASGVSRMVLGQGFALVGAGLCIGVCAGLAAARGLTALLYGVTATDPATWLAMTALQAAVATAALYLPARRAARLHPAVALRHD
jgi:predicted permease